MKQFSFEINHAKGDPRFMRTGTIHTPHGDIQTPAFIPVATKATVKAMTVDQIESAGAQSLLSNAYHLYLQPGHRLIEKAGGLGKFMNYTGPTFTDSGGFQVLSLGSGYKKTVSMDAIESSVAKKSTRRAFVDDNGVTFKSHIDGSLHTFTPELSMEIQHAIGADICFAFDELTSLAEPYEYHVEALERTHRWAERSVKQFRQLQSTSIDRPHQALFGVLQGANIESLRRETAEFMRSLDFDGYGIGGAIEKSQLSDIVRWTTGILPADKPKHLLGIGEPDDIFAGVAAGIDTFDCVSPTRVARNGAVYTLDGRYNLRAAIHASSFVPLSRECECEVCQHYSRAYIHHLLRAKERLAATLISYHNEFFILSLMKSIRTAIKHDTFDALRSEWTRRYYKSK